ncbi:transposase [Altericroceibacterium xinjiangense]|uniref:transposase n=1 Tax=Altericroceibacterium xinjiangense TaxID=762261 RepID=UPI000F7DEF03|nr:transposase [Altericroceibacterium xinjiangense]
MPTQCSARPHEFARVENRSVVAAFDGGAVTSDAGGLLLGSTDRAIRLVERFAGCFTDHRRADLIEHEGTVRRNAPDSWHQGALPTACSSAQISRNHPNTSVSRSREPVLPATIT